MLSFPWVIVGVMALYGWLVNITDATLESIFNLPLKQRDRHNYIREITGIIQGLFLSWVTLTQNLATIPLALQVMVVYYLLDLYTNGCIMTRPYILHHLIVILSSGGMLYFEPNSVVLGHLVRRFLQVEYSTVFLNLRCMLRRYRRLRGLPKGNWDKWVLDIPFYLLFIRYRVLELIPLCWDTWLTLSEFPPPLAWIRYIIGGFLLLNLYWS